MKEEKNIYSVLTEFTVNAKKEEYPTIVEILQNRKESLAEQAEQFQKLIEKNELWVSDLTFLSREWTKIITRDGSELPEEWPSQLLNYIMIEKLQSDINKPSLTREEKLKLVKEKLMLDHILPRVNALSNSLIELKIFSIKKEEFSQFMKILLDMK